MGCAVFILVHALDRLRFVQTLFLLIQGPLTLWIRNVLLPPGRSSTNETLSPEIAGVETTFPVTGILLYRAPFAW